MVKVIKMSPPLEKRDEPGENWYHPLNPDIRAVTESPYENQKCNCSCLSQRIERQKDKTCLCFEIPDYSTSAPCDEVDSS